MSHFRKKVTAIIIILAEQTKNKTTKSILFKEFSNRVSLIPMNLSSEEVTADIRCFLPHIVGVPFLPIKIVDYRLSAPHAHEIVSSIDKRSTGACIVTTYPRYNGQDWTPVI